MQIELLSIEEIDKAILQFEQVSNGDYNHVKNQFQNILKTYAVPVSFWSAEVLNSKTRIYRVRSATGNQFDLSDPTQFSYIQAPEKVRLGRGNIAAHPIFYGSDSAYTALHEIMRHDPAEKYYVSQWSFDIQAESAATVPVVQYFGESLPKVNPWSTLIHSKSDMIERFTNDVGSENAQALTHLTLRLAKLFNELSPDQYHLTSYLSHNCLYEHDSVYPWPYILVYPSVATSKESCNFAIHPDFVDQCMKLDKVYEISTPLETNGKIKINGGKIGFPEGSQIKWYTPKPITNTKLLRIDQVNCANGVLVSGGLLDDMTILRDGEKVHLTELLDHARATYGGNITISNTPVYEGFGKVEIVGSQVHLKTNCYQAVVKGVKHQIHDIRFTVAQEISYHPITLNIVS